METRGGVRSKSGRKRGEERGGWEWKRGGGMKRVKSSSKQDGGEGINSRRIIGCREYIYNKYAKQRPSITDEDVGVF